MEKPQVQRMERDKMEIHQFANGSISFGICTPFKIVSPYFLVFHCVPLSMQLMHLPTFVPTLEIQHQLHQHILGRRQHLPKQPNGLGCPWKNIMFSTW
jgi:hypothetical protein